MRYSVTDDCTININSIYRDERIWLQRVEWEWVSHETIFEDELTFVKQYLHRTKEEVEACYAQKEIDDETIKEFLIDKIRGDSAFTKRCLLLLSEDRLLRNDLVALYGMLNHVSDSASD